MDSDHPAAITGTCVGDNTSSSCSSLPSCSCDFSFAYNNSSLSDRVLRLEIVDPSSSIDSSDSECSNVNADWPKNRKRRRADSQKEIGENSPGAPHSNNLNGSEVRSRVVRVETIHISSAILAARSPFFRQLFLNGMAESQQRHATLQISSSEETAVIELLKFIYGKSLSSTSALALLDLLMVADKYEVSSCKWRCCQLLQNLPMTPESALLYLELPSSLSTASPFLDLTKLAKQFLIDCYKDQTNMSNQELMELPLVGIEAVLSSDDLQVISEDEVYDFVLQWALAHYQNIEERRDILATRLIPLVRFPYMTCHKLKMIRTNSDLDHELLSELVFEALFFKSETPYQKSVLAKEQSSNMGRRYVERSYFHRPIKVVELSLPRRQCVVYFDLKREEFVNSPSGWVRSVAFAWARQNLYLQSGCAKDKQTSDTGFGMGLGMLNVGSTSVKVDYEFAAMSKQTPCQYNLKYKGTSVINGVALPIGHLNLFNMPWSSFIAEDSEYFINNVLHLRVKVSVSD